MVHKILLIMDGDCGMFKAWYVGWVRVTNVNTGKQNFYSIYGWITGCSGDPYLLTVYNGGESVCGDQS